MLILTPMQLWSLNLRHLRAATRVMAHGGITAAAPALAISQSAVTQAIGKLERQFAQPLFERLPAGMAATPAMILLAPRIDAALAHIGSSRVTAVQWRALIALGDAGSYAAASADTGLAQPSLHRAVRDLSLALRRELVARRGRGVAFTEAGRRVLRGFRLARAELAAGLVEVAAQGGSEAGRIVVGAMPLARARLLPAAIAQFRRAHPEVALSIVEGAHAELIEPLRDGEIDLLIGALREAPGDDVIQSPLFDDRPLVIGRRGHPLAGTSPGPAELARFDWTIPAIGTPLRMQWQSIFTGAGLAPPAVPVECGSVIVIRGLLMDSDLLTLLSRDQVAAELAAGWLAVIGPVAPDIVRTIGVTVRRDWRPTSSQQAFLEQLAISALQ